MPPKPLSPEKSLIKGNYHKRMQSMQNTDTKSEFLNYLESRSPEKSLRASVLDASPKSPKSPKSPEKVNKKLEDAPSDNQEGEREAPPHFSMNNRYLSKPILNEPTPPSATMLALQNMQLPSERETTASTRSKESSPTPLTGPPSTGPQGDPHNPGLESLSTQIHSLTDIASNLQREMAQLSRRSKDNATDLISLKAATNARDEDIRKSLRELSSNLTSKFLDAETSGRWDYSSVFGSDPGISHRERARSPNPRKSHSIPRMPSPSPFAAMERDLCGSPGPISDGSASIALLEKVLREMATKEGQEKLLDAVDEIKSRPMPDSHGNDADRTMTDMLEEILQLVKTSSGSQALVRSKIPANPFEGGADTERPRARSLDPEQVLAPDMEILHSDSGSVVEPHLERDITQEMLDILKRVKTSVIEGGGMTNEVKALVRELRGEILGMGRNIAEKLEEDERARSVEGGKPQPLSKEEVAAVVDGSLADLKELLASVVNESRESSSAFSELRSSMNGDEIYSIVRQALDEQSSAEPRGDEMRKEEILDAIREGWETYKPEIELQNFGLERDEILECLAEGLKSYQPQHENAVTYDQVLAAVQAGMQNFEQPPTITKDEIVQTIRETLAGPEAAASRSLADEQVARMKDEILQAVTQSVTSQNALTRDTLNTGLGRDEILRAVSEGIEAHFSPSKRLEQPQVTKEDVTNAVNEAFSAQHSALSTQTQAPPVSRDEVLGAIAEGLENHNPIAPEIELNKDDLMDAISSALNDATASANAGIGDKVLERFHEVLRGMKDEFKQYSEANGSDNQNVLNAVKDGVDVIRKEIEGYAGNAGQASGKNEILETVKEGFRLLQADMEKIVADAPFANAPRGNPDTPELLDAMEKEFEHLRQSITSMLMRSDLSSDKEQILDAINDVTQFQKDQPKKEDLVKTIQEQFENQPGHDEVVKTIKEEFEKIHKSMDTTLSTRSEPTIDKEDIIAALRQSLETFQEEATRSKSGGEALLLNAFNDGVGAIKSDLAKVLGKPTGSDSTELLEALKEGLGSLKAEVEAIRKAQLESDEAMASAGKELTLAKEVNRSDNVMDGLRVMVGQLQAKVEAIEPSPRSPEPAEDAMKKDHLDEVVAGLKELKESVASITARESPPSDEAVAKKGDTDAIETLLRNTKAQLDELKFPEADQIAKSEQINALENVVKETKDAVSELSNRLECEGPTKTEIGTLESLLKDMWIAFDEFKTKSESKDEEAEKLVKSDLQTVEAMIFEVKTQIEELKLPDVETLPTKTDIEGLSTLVTQFREKTEADNELTAQRFDARKSEHNGIAEKIDQAKAVVEGLGDELKSKLDGSSEGLSELKQVLEGLASSAENFTTVENIKELTDLINREFERVHGDQEASKSEREEKDAAAMVKHDENRAAVIAELGTKIDEKVGEVMAKYEEAQTAVEGKLYASEERDNASLEAITNIKALAEDIKLVIGAMDNSVNESCERISTDTKAFFEKVDESYNQVKTSQEQSRADFKKTAAATDRLESELHQFHPQVLEGVQEVLTLVGQHYGHSQRSTQDIKTDISSLPSSIVRLLPPPPEKYDDTKAQEKLDSLLGHARDTHVQDALKVIVERVTSEQVHQKLDQLMSQTRSTNSQVYEKLEELLGHAVNSNRPVHDKLDTLIGHATNTDQSVTQMMKLDEIHKDMMESSRRMQEILATQSAMLAKDNERKRKEAEEAAVALERRTAQKEQVEAEIESFREEKESLLSIISTLKSEKEDLAQQNAKMSKELSGLEMALELRHEEMQVMEERAESLEKRILEGVLDHARSVLIRGPNRMNSKRARGTRARGPSGSNGSGGKDGRGILGNGVGMALKKRPSQKESAKDRRIFSLSHVTGNRGAGDRQVSGGSGISNLKRSHSVKSNMSQRKASWGGSVANKENEAFPEGDESDAGTERRTSYAPGGSEVGDDDDAQTTKGNDTDDQLEKLDEETKRLVLYKKHRATDSGVGTEISSGAE